NLVLAPDGRLVMSISANCDHCTPRSPWSGSIVSFRPDGSDVHFYARHLRAGYGMAYFPGTSDLLVSMNQRNDLGARTTGDALALVRDGDDWASRPATDRVAAPAPGCRASSPRSTSTPRRAASRWSPDSSARRSAPPPWSPSGPWA